MKAVLSAVISSILVLRYDLVFFQSLGIQVVLTILLITCTVSFTTRVVDLHKFYRDSIGGFTLPGSTVALIYAATVSEFKIYLVSGQESNVFQSCGMCGLYSALFRLGRA